MHEQNIICSKTCLNSATHEQTIICRQLYAGHVVGCRPMERKKTMRWMIKTKVTSRCLHYIAAAILVHIWCALTWRFHTELCKFLQNISTNIFGLGKHTDVKLGEVSSLFTSNEITISWLYPLNSFWFNFFIAWQWKWSICTQHLMRIQFIPCSFIHYRAIRAKQAAKSSQHLTHIQLFLVLLSTVEPTSWLIWPCIL